MVSLYGPNVNMAMNQVVRKPNFNHANVIGMVKILVYWPSKDAIFYFVATLPMLLAYTYTYGPDNYNLTCSMMQDWLCNSWKSMTN